MGNLVKSINIFLSAYGLSLNCDPKEDAELIHIGIVDSESKVVGSVYKAKDGSFCFTISSLELGSLRGSINLEIHDGVKTYCFDSVLKKKTHCFDEIVEQMKVVPSFDEAIMPKIKSSLDFYKTGSDKVKNPVLHFNGTNMNYAHNIKTRGHELSLNNPENECEIPITLWILKNNGDSFEVNAPSKDTPVGEEFFVCTHYEDRDFEHPKYSESFDPQLGYTDIESIYAIANEVVARRRAIQELKTPISPQETLPIIPIGYTDVESVYNEVVVIRQAIQGLKTPMPPQEILQIIPNISRINFDNKNSINIFYNLLSLLYCNGERFKVCDLINMFGVDLQRLPNAPIINHEGIVGLRNEIKPPKTIESTEV